MVLRGGGGRRGWREAGGEAAQARQKSGVDIRGMREREGYFFSSSGLKLKFHKSSGLFLNSDFRRDA